MTGPPEALSDPGRPGTRPTSGAPSPPPTSPPAQPVAAGGFRHRRVLVVAATALALLAVVLRRPDAVLSPQFWAEDGVTYYASAYAAGPSAILQPVAGYLTLLPRLVAAAAVGMPLALGPAAFVAVALAVQVLPVAILLSRRFDTVVPRLAPRLALAVVYVTLPNSNDVDANLVNAQWHLALAAVMLVLARPPAGWAGRAGDLATVALSGLTGPFGLLTAIVGGLRWGQVRGRWILGLTGLAAATAAVQAIVLFGPGARQRPFAAVGLAPAVQLHVLTGQVFAGALVGMRGYQVLYASEWWLSSPVQGGVAALGLAVCAYAGWRGPAALRLFLLYAALLFVAMWAGRQAGSDPPTVYEQPLAGNRYYLVPMLAFLASLLWILATRRVRSIVLPLALLWLLVGVPIDWSYPPYADLGFPAQARAFAAAPPGARFDIPINPPPWRLTLVKR